MGRRDTRVWLSLTIAEKQARRVGNGGRELGETCRARAPFEQLLGVLRLLVGVVARREVRSEADVDDQV